jgi:hypothetical protein
MPEPQTDALVARDDLAAIRLVAAARAPAPGEALLRVERLALTANTVTYARHGQTLGYDRFWPGAPEGWRCVPAWGTATVVASRAAGLAEGTRVFGFWPMASHALVRPERIGPRGFLDAAPHRADLPAAYNQYRLGTGGVDERLVMLLEPLYLTSFLIDDALAAEGFAGAEAVLLSSASSKTALALAHALAQRPARPRVVGLTSPGNAGFCAATGFYDAVMPYAGLEDLPAGPAAYVDFAGDRVLRARVHRHFGGRLVASLAVGDTHRGEPSGGEPLPGARPRFFFAPARLAQRRAEWGGDGLARRIEAGWRAFAATAPAWLRVVEAPGGAALMARWAQTVAGGTPPDEGVIVSLAEAEAQARA